MADSIENRLQEVAGADAAGKVEANRAKSLPVGVDLQLVVRDPEVVAELLRHPEGAERDRYALAALRLGVMSMRMAGGIVDADTIKETGRELVHEIGEVLTRRSTDIEKELARYFDPQSGQMQQRIDSLLKKDGDLARVLGEHFGPGESVIARTLAEHLGSESPVFKMLSPTDSRGLKVQLETAVKSALDEQRDKVVAQFSLDNKESALSRLVGQMSEHQGKLGENLAGQIQGLVKEFSADSEGSALNRLKREINETLEKKHRVDAEFHKDVRETLAEFRVRRDESSKSTRHGNVFEEQLGELIAAEAQRLGDIFSNTGNTTGLIKNCKVGDHVVELGAETVAPGVKIVWEAKEDKSYSLSAARDEIEVARKNRDAQVGIFVFSKRICADVMEPFSRYGSNIVIAWDAEDPSTDLYVRAAYSVARALTVREGSRSDDSGTTIQNIALATREIEKQIKYLDEFEKWGGTIKNNAEKIIDRSAKMRDLLTDQVSLLDDQVASLRS